MKRPHLWNAELANSDDVDSSSSCTITVPGISGRVLRYSVAYRNSGGTVLGVSPVRVKAIQ